MSLNTSAGDLADQASKRARVAALLGRLLLSEPGADVAALVADVPSLAPLGRPTPDLAAEYERLLLREIPPYESVFCSEDGQRGGPLVAEIAELYERHGLDDADLWRVAGVDHLGLELRCYGSLCAEEARGWEDDQPDVAVRAVEASRDLLASHLGTWGEVAMAAVRRRAAPGPYRALAEAVAKFLAQEADRLRPHPDHPDLPEVVVDEPPARLGPARLARWLLAPARCGAYLDVDDLADAALGLGIPWRPSDPRSRFRQVVEDAVDGGDLPVLLARLRPAVERWHEHHAAREAEADGVRRSWRSWRLRTERTLALFDRLATDGNRPSATDESRTIVTVRGAGHAERTAAAIRVLDRLRVLDLTVAVSADLDPALAGAIEALLVAGADDVLLVGATVSVGAVRDGGDLIEREERHLADAPVVVRLRPSAGPTQVDVEGDHEVATQVRRCLQEGST